MAKSCILLTGGNGMVGQNIRKHHLAGEWDIVAPSSKDLDLTNFAQTVKFFDDVRPDIVVHAAGKVGGVQANLSNPTDFLVTNMDLGRNVILAARDVGIPKLLNLASSCMYPRQAPNPICEDQILKGELEPTNEGYALAKIFATRLCSYINSENPDLTYKTFIPCNLYGRYDNFDPARSHLLPAIIHKVHEAKVMGKSRIEIWGDGTARREFLYAGDFADAVLHGIKDFAALPDLINIGVGRDYSVNEYYSAVAKTIGWEGSFFHDTNRPVGMKQKLVNVEKQQAWGWKPSVSLGDGIAKTYEFYLEESLK